MAFNFVKQYQKAQTTEKHFRKQNYQMTKWNVGKMKCNKKPEKGGIVAHFWLDDDVWL